MECALCYSKFICWQGHDACPMLPGCGHTFCKKCCIGLDAKYCPFECKVIFNVQSLVPNYSLMSLIGLTTI